MGDRVTLAVQDSGKRVYLYSHWNGSDMPEILRKALDRHQRWNDPAYLTRIIFQTMVGDNTNETGYGISHSVQDYNHPLIVVDCDAQAVSLESPDDGKSEYYRPSSGCKPVPFEQYASAAEQTWHSLDPENARYMPERA